MKGRIFLGIVVALVGSGLYFWNDRPEPLPGFRTVKIDAGTVVSSVTSTGVVEPLTLVQVGSQISGTIQKIYVDFNDRVKKTEVICELDQTALRATVSQDRANLAQTEANVRKVQAQLAAAEKDLNRSRRLVSDKLISESELDQKESVYKALAAEVDVAEAAVNQARSTLERSLTNLGYATIRSPIDGVIVLRNVDVGQTVAASMQAPVLFEIAETMEKINVNAAVSEADIGMIRAGQPVSFSVDAYSEEEFHGSVLQIRLAPTVDQNVVTYTVVVSAENPDEKLLPGMTANLRFEVGKSPDGSLRVSNQAIRFEPDREWLPPERRDKPEKENPKSDRFSRGVWTLANGILKYIPVKVGLTDGEYTQIVEGDVLAGQEVIVGVREVEGKEEKNPFQRPWGGSKSSSR